jgi:signal transduction histidine kinase
MRTPNTFAIPLSRPSGAPVRPLDALRGASARLAGGDLGARAAASGPRELVELSSSFNEMAANIEQLFDARRQLVAWASHDLRTPLASLSGMVEALEDGLADPEEYVPAIRDQLRILTSLVEDLFELARIDAGELTLQLRESSLGDLISNCVRGLSAEAQLRNVRLDAHMDGDPPVLIAPEKVERVLLNLVTNAMRHTPSGGNVSVVVERREDAVVVAVEDTEPASRRLQPSGCSTASGATTNPATGRPAGPGSDWRSRRESSRRTAAGSGQRTGAPAAHGSHSRLRSRTPESSFRRMV